MDGYVRAGGEQYTLFHVCTYRLETQFKPIINGCFRNIDFFQVVVLCYVGSLETAPEP